MLLTSISNVDCVQGQQSICLEIQKGKTSLINHQQRSYSIVGLGRIPDIQLISYAGYPVSTQILKLARYPANYRISANRNQPYIRHQKSAVYPAFRQFQYLVSGKNDQPNRISGPTLLYSSLCLSLRNAVMKIYGGNLLLPLADLLLNVNC